MAKKASSSGSMSRQGPQVQSVSHGLALAKDKKSDTEPVEFTFLFGSDGAHTLSCEEFVTFVCDMKHGEIPSNMLLPIILSASLVPQTFLLALQAYLSWNGAHKGLMPLTA